MRQYAMSTPALSPAEMFERHVVRRANQEHWGWRGRRGSTGKPKVRTLGGVDQSALRVGYKLLRGPLGMYDDVVPACGDPHCTNPWHGQKLEDALRSRRTLARSA